MLVILARLSGSLSVTSTLRFEKVNFQEGFTMSMSNSTPKDVQDAFYRVTHDFGVEKLAGQMGMSPGVLYNKANYHDNENNHNKPTLADCVVATNLTGDKRIVQAFCHSTGGLYCELPDVSDLSLDALMLHILKVGEEDGHFYSAIHAALADDYEISLRELSAIEREARHLMAAVMEALARMREMSK